MKSRLQSSQAGKSTGAFLMPQRGQHRTAVPFGVVFLRTVWWYIGCCVREIAVLKQVISGDR